jgi:serine protease Do
MLRIFSTTLLTGLLVTASVNAQTAKTPKVYSLNLTGSYLGVGVQEIDAERAKALKLKEEYGVEVTSVESGSPAEKAGLKQGDAVLHYNGQRIEGIDQFRRFVSETPVGREVKLDVVREGKQQNIAAKIGDRPGSTAFAMPKVAIPEIRIPDFPSSVMTWRSSPLGVVGESVDGQLAEFFGVKNGVLVRSVTKDSTAEKAGLKAGDIIVKIDDSKVYTPSDVSNMVRMSRGKSVPVVVMRDRKEVTLTVNLSDDRSDRAKLRARTVRL